MAQWIKRNMCGQEYQELSWVSLLSASQGTPQIIVHRLQVLKLEMPVILFPSYADPLSALLRSCFRSCALLGELPKAILSTKTDLVDLPLSCVPIIPVNLTAGIQMSSVFHVTSPTTPPWSVFGN